MSTSTLEIPNRRTRPGELDPVDRMFRHTVHPEWGIGVWMREERTRRRLRFEDGEMRAFKKGFYEFLKPVDSDKVDVDEVFQRVVGEHADAQGLEATGEPPVMPFGRQLELFLEAFPGGFHGEAFQKTWGEDATKRKNLAAAMELGKRLKKTRDPGEAVDLTIELMSSTTLVTRKRIEGLKKAEGEARVQLGQAIIELIHGDARFGQRMTAWLDTLEKLRIDPGWRGVTAVLAFCQPDKHVLVRRGVFQLQGRSTSPCKIPAAPTLAGYRRARRVARKTRDKLVEAGLKPRHLFDVHVFIWETLRPKALKQVQTDGA